MTKIEPMTVEEIKALVAESGPRGYRYPAIPYISRLVLAWAHERARANRNYFDYLVGIGGAYDSRKLNWTDTTWLNEALKQIGWPEGDFSHDQD